MPLICHCHTIVQQATANEKGQLNACNTVDSPVLIAGDCEQGLQRSLKSCGDRGHVAGQGLWKRFPLQPQLEIEMLAQNTVWVPSESLQQQLPERTFHFRFLPDSWV